MNDENSCVPTPQDHADRVPIEEPLLEGQVVFNGPQLLPSVSESDKDTTQSPDEDSPEDVEPLLDGQSISNRKGP